MVTHHLGITEAQRKQVSDEVARAEDGTSGQIVPVIVGRSHAYADVTWRIAVCFALLLAYAISRIAAGLAPVFYLGVEIPLLILGLVVASRGAAQRRFLHQDRMRHEVQQRAVQAFHAHGLSACRERNGILILISVLERRVEVLADIGIHARVPDGTWSALIDGLTAKFRDGETVQGLQDAISECGSLLRKYFPAPAGGVNELPNELSIED